MEFHDVKALSGSIGLAFFFLFFLGVLIWTFRPGSRKRYDAAGRIPLKED
jgi:cytochrome c oxidase cbb3-type subunit 4